MPAVTVSLDEVEQGKVDINALLLDATKAEAAATSGEVMLLHYAALELMMKYNIKHSAVSLTETTLTAAFQGKLGFLEHTIATVHLEEDVNKEYAHGRAESTVLEKFICVIDVFFYFKEKKLVLEPSITVGDKRRQGKVELHI